MYGRDCENGMVIGLDEMLADLYGVNGEEDEDAGHDGYTLHRMLATHP